MISLRVIVKAIIIIFAHKALVSSCCFCHVAATASASVLHYVELCCSVMQCEAVWSSVMQCDAVWCSVIHCDTVWQASPQPLPFGDSCCRLECMSRVTNWLRARLVNCWGLTAQWRSVSRLGADGSMELRQQVGNRWITPNSFPPCKPLRFPEDRH